MKKFQGSVIFWTLLSKNCPLFDNFNKQLILVKFIKGNNKSGPKFSLELMEEICLKCDYVMAGDNQG